MRIKWTEKLLKTSEKLLSKNSSLDEALVEISKIAGQKVTENMIRSAFSTHGLGSPRSLLQPPKYVPDPVTRQEKKEEESRDRQHIKQLVEQVRELRARQSVLDVVSSFKAPPKIMPREKNSGIREMTAVVLASDWHVEEPVYPEAVAYRNEYNLDIADTRIKRFFDGIIWNIEHHRSSQKVAIRDLILWLGGDLMSGYIHPELVESNALSPTETIRWLIPRLRNGIKTLLEVLRLEKIIIPCSFGNHGRSTEKPRISTSSSNSFEWIMYHSLADSFVDDERIVFEITPSAHQYVQAYNFTLHFHHGDDLKYQGGVGGIGIPLLKAVSAWDTIKRADYRHIGHFHQLRDYGRAVVNGSLIGYGPYSQRIRAEFEVPAQAFYLLDSKRGKCMMTSIWVDGDTHQCQDMAANG